MMLAIRWEALKLRACRELSTSFHLNKQGIYGILQRIEQQMTGQTIKAWRENGKELRQQAWELVEHWDVRCAAKLIEVFPGIIAKKYRGKTPMAEYDENCNWILTFED